MIHVLVLQVLPLAHTTGSNRDEVQLVNPQGVDLKAYEARLETAISDYKRYNYDSLHLAVFSGLRKSAIQVYADNQMTQS